MLYPRQLKQYSAQCLAELFGTFILVFLGDLAVAQSTFTKVQDRLAINLSFATGVYVGLMVAGPISGAHINPAVSIGLLSLRKMKVIQCLFYIVGQIVGAFLASAMVYLIYLSQFTEYDGGTRQITGLNQTGTIFYTAPGDHVPQWNCFIDVTVGTALLLIFIMALGNDYNHLISNAAKPFSFALMITTFGYSMNLNCGNPINPARDFGPRLFAACVYGRGVFSVNNYYFWIPLVAPVLGAIIGVWIFEGYLILMKKYANLPGIIHIDAVELPDQGDPPERPHRSGTQVVSEAY